MDFNSLGSIDPLLGPDDQSTGTDPSFQPCQYCGAYPTPIFGEAKDWTTSQPPQPLALALFPSSSLFSYPESGYGDETSTSSAEIFESSLWRTMHFPGCKVLLGEMSQSLFGSNSITDPMPFSTKRASIPQQVNQDSLQQVTKQHSETATPCIATVHRTTDKMALTVQEQDFLNSLSIEHRFLIDCRRKGLPWELVVERFAQNWAYQNKSALGMRLTRLKRKHPVINQILSKQ
ncbi:hypothetical protein FSARC_11243 [Fusarium sarcochroum]|uniref:Myb-like domain-containing protein n=1 Tax=Fusarium sarcochroum TaxID=1208366 RepID=A0A8H4X1I6_9HYPO|nr:hypothetical protein FSARC_11243 [Fusarium sarcochroum]